MPRLEPRLDTRAAALIGARGGGISGQTLRISNRGVGAILSIGNDADEMSAGVASSRMGASCRRRLDED